MDMIELSRNYQLEFLMSRSIISTLSFFVDYGLKYIKETINTALCLHIRVFIYFFFLDLIFRANRRDKKKFDDFFN